jgi:hypothetical protein
MTKLEHDLLSLLVADEESFAILHADLIRNCGYSRDFAVDEVLDALTGMEQKNWVVSRFGSKDGDPPTPDEIDEARDEYVRWLQREGKPGEYVSWLGPWYRLTERGQVVWRQMKEREEQGDANGSPRPSQAPC